ncbi:flagellar assembly peptidoglycan hydrolase FlgJ [Eionea flava]
MINSIQKDMSSLIAQQSYTDLSSLQDIKKIGNEDKNLALRKVAEQFESMFIQMMLKSMRSANDVFGKDNPLNSFEMKHHQDMYDKQLSLSLGASNNLGLADAFYRQMSNNYGLNSSSKESETQKKFDVSSIPRNDISNYPLINKAQYESRESISYSLNTSVVESAQILLGGISSPKEFADALTPYMKKAADILGVDYRALIAQSALETGWGKHIIQDTYGKSSFNLFNIKADNRWGGKSVAVPTVEYVNGVAKKEVANFRRYNSLEESISDYQNFITQQPRYSQALSSPTTEGYIEELQKAGYATDPSYAEKIKNIMNNMLVSH